MNAKRIGIILVVILATLVGGYFLVGGKEDGEGTSDVKGQLQALEDVTPKEARDLIQNNKDSKNFVTIDLRTPNEYAAGHIGNATNLDYYSSYFRNELEKLDKTKTYLIYCQSGRRSAASLEIMKGLGFKEVYNVTGGIADWQAEGLPTTM